MDTVAYRGGFETKYVRLISPLTEPFSSVFHSPLLLQRREKGTCWYCVAATVFPRCTENIFVLGPAPPCPKHPVVWGTRKKLVYGYSNIQRGGGGSGTKYVRAHLTPHRTPRQNMLGLISPLTEPFSSVFHSPLLLQRRKKNRRLWVLTATVPPAHRKYFCPGPTPPRPKQPVVWGTGKKIVYGYSSIQRGGFWDKTCYGPFNPSPSPPAVFFTPLSAS